MKVDEDIGSSSPSVEQYAIEVFGEALVTGVPNIVKTHNWKRKMFKFSVLLLCITGFLYQTIEFLTYVFSYPSIVDITVRHPSEYLLPAFTVCNNNGFMRSKFCQKYPEKCETPANKTEFCDANPNYSEYCEDEMLWENFTVIKDEFSEYEKHASLKDMKELTHEQEGLFVKGFSADNDSRYGIEGPLIFFKNMERFFSCYTIHSRAKGTKDPIKLAQDPLYTIRPRLNLEIDFELSETFLPGRRPRGFLTIHSPFDYGNPFEFGHCINPGKFYKIIVNMQEEELLPYPYQSDCVNYSQIWLDTGKEGPRSQQMCKLECLYNISKTYCNCTFKSLSYPYNEDECFSESFQCVTARAMKEALQCLATCKDDCEKNKFPYVVQEREVEDIEYVLAKHWMLHEWPSKWDKERQITYLSIYLSEAEVTVFNHRPQFHSVEMFSYIGGYIGVWLGISLVAVADFMECTLLTAAFAFRQWKQAKIPSSLRL